jgi:NDP-sugar pyrophosphorylase family protein
MTRAMMLCAGLGTRLEPLTDHRPKPMMPVCDYSILRYGIANLVGHGICDIVINTHHLGAVIRNELGDGSAFGARIQYVHEDVILGTGGGLKNAVDLLDANGTDEPFLSLNGKLIFDVDLGAVLEAYSRLPDALGMMVVRHVPDALEWGAVDCDDESGTLRVRNILGEGSYMFGGIHATRPSVVRRLPDGEACMVRQGYLPWIREGAHVAAFEAGPGYFAEHSTPARYLQSNIDLLGSTELRHPPGAVTGIDATATVDATATIREPVRIGPGATIGPNATVGPNAVVGTNATVSEGASVTRAIVWPGAHASGAIANAVVMSDATVDLTD